MAANEHDGKRKLPLFRYRLAARQINFRFAASHWRRIAPNWRPLGVRRLAGARQTQRDRVAAERRRQFAPREVPPGRPLMLTANEQLWIFPRNVDCELRVAVLSAAAS